MEDMQTTWDKPTGEIKSKSQIKTQVGKLCDLKEKMQIQTPKKENQGKCTYMFHFMLNEEKKRKYSQLIRTVYCRNKHLSSPCYRLRLRILNLYWMLEKLQKCPERKSRNISALPVWTDCFIDSHVALGEVFSHTSISWHPCNSKAPSHGKLKLHDCPFSMLQIMNLVVSAFLHFRSQMMGVEIHKAEKKKSTSNFVKEVHSSKWPLFLDTFPLLLYF